jgi:hypothetical protein
MRFRLYREYGSLNSGPIFNAFEQGVKSLGHEIVQSQEDVAVIWSVLWAGRMVRNRDVYQACVKNNIPVIIIEVGNLIRNHSWRICLNNINGLGKFGNDQDLDSARPAKLGIKLSPYKETRRPEILIAAQHQQSHQWNGQPRMHEWATKIIGKLSNYTQRRIIVRPHPRSPFSIKLPNVTMETPKPLPGSYDDFNIDYNYHCVINYNSGPAVQAAIKGIPVICNRSSLAAEVSNVIEDIENIKFPDRADWFLKLTHTEWTKEEISQGIPLSRILPQIS